MAGERDLERLLRTMSPSLREGTYVFATVPESEAAALAPEATVRESEGLSVLVRREAADARGLAYDYVAALITLRVHSALEAVGLTAAVSSALAAAGISCNVVAGRCHDHLLVPADRAEGAMDVLAALAEKAR